MNTSSLTLDFLLVNAIVGVLLPILTQLVVRAKASPSVKALINLVLATIAGVLTPYLTLDHVPWQSIAVSVVQVLVTSITSYVGLMKPTGLAGSTGLIAQKVPGGIGTETPTTPETPATPDIPIPPMEQPTTP
jgi:hypothetical protein